VEKGEANIYTKNKIININNINNITDMNNNLKLFPSVINTFNNNIKRKFSFKNISAHIEYTGINNNNNSIQFFIIYVPSQQPQGHNNNNNNNNNNNTGVSVQFNSLFI
jgi:hypothetical protein